MLHLHATSESGFVKQRHNLLLHIKFKSQFYAVDFWQILVYFNVFS